jgi:hypothetical protein
MWFFNGEPSRLCGVGPPIILPEFGEWLELLSGKEYIASMLLMFMEFRMMDAYRASVGVVMVFRGVNFRISVSPYKKLAFGVLVGVAKLRGL